eukprot:TRINITY_DN4148_c0_g3_i1.p1 TRINITY_DN4148_c0_g3~~TRINITY_DN4148_c0_g3_i1.p1  ORF type:complete len:248 (+),score=19.57 TRINITY_DN4148_c0_g3_i1:57-800(+)
MATVECEVTTLAGSAVTLMVQLDWKVATLKEQVERETSLPCYLQVLSTGDSKLQDTDELRDVYTAQGSADGRICLFLGCMHVPDQLGQADVRRAWEAFRMHSTDYGDAIPQTNVRRVVRYSGLRLQDGRVEDVLGDLDSVSFADLLSVMEASDSSSRRISEEFVSEPYPFAKSDYPFAKPDVVSSSDDIPVIANARRRTRCSFFRRDKRKRAKSVRLSESTSSCTASSSEQCQEGSCASTHAQLLSL